MPIKIFASLPFHPAWNDLTHLPPRGHAGRTVEAGARVHRPRARPAFLPGGPPFRPPVPDYETADYTYRLHRE